ncbi:MAG: hypothetical protein Q7S63_00300 [bacterium]|nr:hypothetical protein [bacterium]
MEVRFHKELASGRWFTLSIAEQLGNIGSEVGRTRQWQGKDEEKFQGARDRALELFDLTLKDPRWGKGRSREIARAKEVFCDAIEGGKEYGSSLEDMERYFFPFALIARK